VQVEMRAAELEAWIEVDGLRIPDEFTTAEDWGWSDHLNRVVSEPAAGEPADSQWHAGWLAREMATHERRDARDPDAWAWDISRPLAEQLAETARDDGASEAIRAIRDADPARIAEAMAADGHSDEVIQEHTALVAVALDADDAEADALVDEINQPVDGGTDGAA
jgi:hypothetical protein